MCVKPDFMSNHRHLNVLQQDQRILKRWCLSWKISFVFKKRESLPSS